MPSDLGSQNFINKKENILYISPDKKRTDNWLQSLGLQLPPLDHQYGSIREATFSDSIIPDSYGKSNRKNSLKTENLLSPDYGKISESDTSSTDESLHRRSAVPLPLDKGGSDEGDSYIKDTKLDEFFDKNAERAQVIQDKRVKDAESALMRAPNMKKKTLPEKVSERVSFVKRKMVNSADAIRKIAKTVKDEHLYGAFNRARSSMNIVSDMLRNKQTDVFGRKVGERRIFSCRGRRPRRPAIRHFTLKKEHLSMFLFLILLQL